MGCLRIINNLNGCIRNEIIPPRRSEGFELFLPFIFQIGTHYPLDNLRSLLAGARRLSLLHCECNAFIQNRPCKAHNSQRPGGRRASRQAVPRAPGLTDNLESQVGALRLGAREPGSPECLNRQTSATEANPPAASPQGGH